MSIGVESICAKLSMATERVCICEIVTNENDEKAIRVKFKSKAGQKKTGWDVLNYLKDNKILDNISELKTLPVSMDFGDNYTDIFIS